MSVDFITFVCPKDINKVYVRHQLKHQVESNNFKFDKVYLVHQNCLPYKDHDFGFPVETPTIGSGIHINGILLKFGIDLAKEQYHSQDKAHYWKYHVVNHLFGLTVSDADYIVFADSDCWMKTPINWIDKGIELLETYKHCFIVSPNDGEPARTTLRMSQQMFLCRRNDFLVADWNQPSFSGEVTDYETMPEYHAMLEGRMEHYCRHVGKIRFVLSPEYRYWHHNRFTNDGLFETDYAKY